jgi:ribosomal protein S18 acetylase RimI-like enzyme
MKEVTIRQATADDVPAIVPLWQEMMTVHASLDAKRFRPAADGAECWSEALAGWLRDENFCALVANAGDRTVGYIAAWLHQPPPIFQPDIYGFVSDICVAADWQQRGIGRRLFETLKEWLREKDASHIELRVAVKNPVSQAFWRNLGFKDYMDHMWYPLEPSS